MVGPEEDPEAEDEVGAPVPAAANDFEAIEEEEMRKLAEFVRSKLGDDFNVHQLFACDIKMRKKVTNPNKKYDAYWTAVESGRTFASYKSIIASLRPREKNDATTGRRIIKKRRFDA